MNNEIIFLVEESIEGGYEAKALSHPIFTEADTLDELRMMVKDAVSCHFDDHKRRDLKLFVCIC
jgi:hypothetical protein